MDITRTKEELRSLTRVVNNSLLSRIFLKRSDVDRDINANTYDHITGEIEIESQLVNYTSEYFNSKVSLTVKGLNDDGVAIIKINCDYILNYSIRPDTTLSDEDLKNFSNTNAICNAWPYIREFVQAMCNRMEISPMALPLLRIVPEKNAPTEGNALPPKKIIKKRAAPKKSKASK